MLFLLGLVSARQYIFTPWFTPPYSSDTTMRILCRGWFCGSSRDLNDASDKLSQIVQEFRNGSLGDSIVQSLEPLLDTGFVPALCASGVLKAFGMAGFSQNIEESLQILRSHDFWSCHEALAFHPYVSEDERARHLEIAAAQGSILAMKKIAIATNNLTVFRHLAFSMVGGWYRRHFGDANHGKRARSIFSGENSETAWQEMFDRAAAGHVPSTAWVIDGFLSGRLQKTADEVLRVIRPVIDNGPWMFSVGDMVQARGNFNKTTVLQFMANAGDEMANLYLSYPGLVTESNV